VLPPLPRAAPQGSRWLPALGPILRNRRALLYVCAYGLHNGEVSAIRAWLVALLVFAAHRAGRPDMTGYATLVATVANLCGTPLIVAVNELAARRDRRSVIAVTMAVSGSAGLMMAAAAALSPIAAALAAIVCVAAATADAGTINAGLVDASQPERRGAFLAVQALSGFGASAVTPILFGFVLDLAGGAEREAAWISWRSAPVGPWPTCGGGSEHRPRWCREETDLGSLPSLQVPDAKPEAALHDNRGERPRWWISAVPDLRGP
jgi:MFS family permease